MSKNVFFGQNDLRFWYFRYKESNYYSWSILIATIVACAIIIFVVIIPQAENYFSIRSEVVALRSKINVMNENVNFMNNVDRSVLNSQLETATKALPAEQDFLLIINALNDSAISSGITLDDFDFNLDKGAVTKSQSSINIVIITNGSIDRVRQFLKEISQKLPISEISSIENSSNSTIINLGFDYKSLPKIVFNEEKPITSLTGLDQALINKLSSWQTTNNQPVTTPSGSSSAVPLFE